MTKNRLEFGIAARMRLLEGMDILSQTVGATLGPRGTTVALERAQPKVQLTRDGARVAGEVQLPGRYADMGAQMLKEVAAKTKGAAGDGAVTAVVLAHEIAREGFKQIVGDANPMLLKRGIDKAAYVATQAIRQMAAPIRDVEDLAAVATTCIGDQAVGQFIGQVLEQVTADGFVAVADGKGLGLEVEYANGFQFDRGYLSAHFMTNPKTREAVVTDPYVIVTSHRVSSADDMMPVLRCMAAAGKRDLVIIAEEVTGDALTILVVNQQKKNLNCLAVKGPEFGDQFLPALEDLALATGARLVAAEQGHEFKNVAIADMGRAGRAIANADRTVIVSPAGAPDAIAARVQQIKFETNQAGDLYAKNRYEQRIARLMGQMALMRVGAATPMMRTERKRQCQDAVGAAKAALEYGVVPGGGVAFLNAAVALEDLCGDNDDETIGIALMRRALEAPIRRIAENFGRDGAMVVETVRRLQAATSNPLIGYDALLDDYEDMFVRGIVDTTKMAVIAVESAASMGSMFLTVESVVASAC